MRALVLVAAVLLSGVALFLLGIGMDAEVEGLDPGSAGVAVVAPSEPKTASEAAKEQLVAADQSADLAGLATREAADVPQASQRSDGREVELVLRAPAHLATETPVVYLLRARDNLKNLSGGGFDRVKRTLPIQRDKQRWRWSRAVEYGDRVEVFAGWQAAETPAELSSRVLAEEVSAQIRYREIRQRMPRPSRLDRVFARIGDRVSMGQLRGERVVIDMLRRHESEVEVVVVHADGEPAAGVPILRESRGSSTSLGTEGAPISELPRTDDAGRLRMMAMRTTLPPAFVLGSRPIKPTPSPAPRIELPPVGAIDVTLVLESELSTHVIGARPKTLTIEPAEAVAFTFDGHWEVQTKIKKDGVRLFPVALGQRFRLTANGSFGRAAIEIEGPTEAGEVVQAELTTNAIPRLRLKLIDDAGAPLGGCQIELAKITPWARGRSEPRQHSGMTDAEGTATLWLREISAGDVLGQVLLVAEQDDDSEGLQPSGQLVAERRLEKPLTAGVNDSGTWTLKPEPHLVSGRVVNGQGAPVPGASIKVQVQRGQRRASQPTMTWPRPAVAQSARSGPDGSFAIHWHRNLEEDKTRRLALMCAKDGATLFEGVPFMPGDRGVELVLDAPGGIRIDLTQLAPEAFEGLRLTLEREREHGDATELQPGRLLELKHKKPGAYVCRVSYPPESEVLVGDLMIRPGEMLKDPRLNPLLPGAIGQRLTLFVTGAGGAPLSSIVIGRVHAGRVDRTSRLPSEGGAFRFLAYLKTPPDGYWIEADGHRRLALDDLRDGAAIELKPAITVTVQLVGADLPGVPLRLNARWTSELTTQPRNILVTFDAQGRGTFEAPQPGSYVLTSAAGGRRRTSTTSSPASKPWWGATFTVPEDGGEVTAAAK